MTSFSANRFLIACFAAWVTLSGCASKPIKATDAQELLTPVEVTILAPDKPSPRVAAMATVRWTAAASGGVGRYTYTFWSFDGRAEVAEQKGPSPEWNWKPLEPGTYRIKVIVRDAQGNTAESGWSPEFLIAPQLVVSLPSPDKTSPQAAEMATVRWTAGAVGGVGEHSFEFRLHDGKAERTVQNGPSHTWDWNPTKPGSYRVQVVVRDSIGTTMESSWYHGYWVVPKLVLSSIASDKPPPQVAEMATVRWRAESAGGVGGNTYEFHIHDGKEDRPAQEGPSPAWEWKPMEPGSYRVKAVVRDAIGNSAESGWSPEYGIAPKLVVTSIAADKASPQAAELATIRWSVEATGGIGERSFEFRLSDGKAEKVVQTGTSGVWRWSPVEPGTYRLRAVVRDSIGNTVEGDWSREFVVAPKLSVTSLTPDKASPQAAEMATIRWNAAAAGGVGEHTFEFLIHDGKEEKTVQKGPSPAWEWRPVIPGNYRVKTVVGDSIENRVESGWSPDYVVAFPLVASLLAPAKPSPQAAETATIQWKAEAAGGVGRHVFEFRIHDGKEEKTVQKGRSPAWDWRPALPGVFRVKVAVADAIGNTVETGWSADYAVAPKLTVLSLSPDLPSPQPATLSTIRWTANVKGGVGDRTYTFRQSDGKGERAVQSGPLAYWDWSPRRKGSYRMKVVVRDSIGNVSETEWSSVHEIGLPLEKRSLLAVMPMENLSGVAVPLKGMISSLRTSMKAKGIALLEEDAIEQFMEKHRVRYAGGLTPGLGKDFLEEIGVKAVLFVSLDHFDDAVPPKIAITARLVSAGMKTEILWMDAVAIAGNDAPGILHLGMINDPGKLWDIARDRITASMEAYLSGKEAGGGRKAEKRFRPKSQSGIPQQGRLGKERLSIAVLPFLNDSTRRNAGEIMTLQFVRALSDLDGFHVVDPGAVRQALLMSRTIMEGGLSLPQADLLREILDVDLVLMGNVFEYVDYGGPLGNPGVNFSVRIYDTKTRKVGWSSISYNRGDDGVFFFKLGKVNTAHAMASRMVRAVVEKMSGQ